MSNPNYPKPRAEDYMQADGAPLLGKKKKKHKFQNGRKPTGKAVAQGFW
jgi:hypothetical protein